VASPQLRNQGTIAGNICQKPRCWYYRGEFNCFRKGGDRCYAVAGENAYHCIFGGGPCFIVHPSDTAPALAAFGASIRIAGPKGIRSVPVEKFFVLPSVNVRKETVLEPGEIVTAIVLPQSAGTISSYRKVRARNSWDFALAGAAIAVKQDKDIVTSARVVLSGAAPVPWRSKETEDAIIGRRIDEGVIAKAAEAVVRGARPLGQNSYKVHLFQGIILEELAKLRNP
jgi:xanthine dehydrogenase YagS FAD-binding subunit